MKKETDNKEIKEEVSEDVNNQNEEEIIDDTNKEVNEDEDLKEVNEENSSLDESYKEEVNEENSSLDESYKEEVIEDESIDEEKVEDLIDERDLKIEELEAKINDLANKYALAYADTQNMQKRLLQEAEQVKKYRIQSFALNVLPVIDNLERALDSYGKRKEDGFYKGVKMIYDQLIHALNEEGVEEIDCLNKTFDPNFEQAIIQEKVLGVYSGTVVEVLQKGYMLKDRVLRAAMVKVSE